MKRSLRHRIAAASVFGVVVASGHGWAQSHLQSALETAPRARAAQTPPTQGPEEVPSNPVAPTAASVAAGKKYFDGNCAACHGDLAQGAVKAGMTLPGIDELKGRQPPDLTDDQWDHGSSDGEIFRVIQQGLPPTLMPGFEGGIPDNDIWNVVNYLRSLQQPGPTRDRTK